MLKFSVLFPISIIQIGQDNILRLEEVGEVLVHGLHAAGHGVRDYYGGVAWTSEIGDYTLDCPSKKMFSPIVLCFWYKCQGPP